MLSKPMKRIILFIIAICSLCNCGKEPSVKESGNDKKITILDTCTSQEVDKYTEEKNNYVEAKIGDTVILSEDPLLWSCKLDYNDNKDWIKKLQNISIPRELLKEVDRDADNVDINVYFRYSEPIDKYTVTYRFIPYSQTSETGLFIANFDSPNSKFSYIHDYHLSTTHTDEMALGDKKVKWQNNDAFLINYINIKDNNLNQFDDYYGNCLIPYSHPLHFLDIDFDGKKELLVSDNYRGQSGNKYKVYKIECDKLIPLHNKQPFSDIRSCTSIDTVNKTITNCDWSGAADGYRITFSLKRDRNAKISHFPKFKVLPDDFKKELIDKNFIIDSITEYVNGDKYRYIRNGTRLELVK